MIEGDDDPFLHSVVGKLTVILRERRGRRWAYVCLCTCGVRTLPRRAEYIRRRGDRSACENCSIGLPAQTLKRDERPEPELPEKQRHLPSGHPIWRVRAQLLAEVIMRPMPSVAVILLAKAQFGWPDDLTREVLAAADGAELVKSFGLWMNAARPTTKRRTRKWCG